MGFVNPQPAAQSCVSARMEESLSRDSTSHTMVVGIKTPQASRPIVVHEAVHLSPTAPLSAPDDTNFVRIDSPPRFEELCDTPPFSQHQQVSAGPNDLPPCADAERALPSLASPVALPTGLSSGGDSGELEGLSTSSGGLFPHVCSNVPSGDPPTLLLEMRRNVQDEKAPIEKAPMRNPAVMSQQHEFYDSDDSVGAPLKGIYEVETLLNVRETADGKREFLIKWKGWGPSWNNWEPEENILDRRLLKKFNQKKRPIKASLPDSLPDAEDFTMQSKRRCAKQAAVNARMAARKEHEEEDKEED
jgi:hypothetical protein